MRRHAALLLVALALAPAAAQTARLSAVPDSVSAGRAFEVEVTVRHAPGEQTVFPSVPLADPADRPPTAVGDTEVLSVRRLPPEIDGDARIDRAVVEAVTFAADSARVGPIPVRIVAEGDTAAVETGAVTVPVRSVLAGEAEPFVAAPIGEPEAFASAAPVWAALGALGVLGLGLLVWILLRMRSRPRPAGALPYPSALAALDRLDREAPGAGASAEAIEASVVGARGVLRGYLADRLGRPVREATTPELEALLADDARVDAAAREAVHTALRPTDLVAFARVRPEPTVVARLRAETRAAVEAVEASVRQAEALPETAAAPTA